MHAWGWMHLLARSLVKHYLNFSQRNILNYQPSADFVGHHYYFLVKVRQVWPQNFWDPNTFFRI